MIPASLRETFSNILDPMNSRNRNSAALNALQIPPPVDDGDTGEEVMRDSLLDLVGSQTSPEDIDRNLAEPIKPRQVGSSTEERALALLGSGVHVEQVASALGVTSSRVSQLLSNENFASKVATLRYEALQEHTERDGKYDSLEDQLLDKLQMNLPFLIKPREIVQAMTAVNNAKRRGQSAPDQSSVNQNIVNLVLPTQIVRQFSTNIDNQVIKVGGTELITMPSGDLKKQLEQIQAERIEQIEHIPEHIPEQKDEHQGSAQQESD